MDTTSVEALNGIYGNFLLRFLLSPRMRLTRHVSLILTMMLVSLATNNKHEYVNGADVYIGWGLLLFIIGCMYANMYVLVPRFLFKGKHALYFLAVAVLLVSAFFIIAWIVVDVVAPYRIAADPEEGSPVQDFLGFCFSFCFIIAASAAVKLFQRLITDTQRISHLEKLTLRSELEQLKNQVNPHFLFNMLNNANVLIRKDAEKASQVLLKLSDLLRYQLYDSARSQVLLTADIRFLTDFLSLENIRRDHFVFAVVKEGNMNNILIPPFLFITFVENAIKHNVDPLQTSCVQLDFKAQENRLLFTCRNSKPATPPIYNKQQGGLGLANVKRRLELLFPGTHTLHIEDRTDSYTVTLTLPL